MLIIPESVKALFRADLTRKNFRVQFPGGELPDITNSNVVRESVHFTESLCSQSVFRFGLAEASVIEFETVGVGNMYGMTISCAYEIDTSSLSAADLAAIQSDPGDGELVLAADSDIGYGYYRVPLGLFRVDRCPRNHGAMTHRQVTAYSLVGGTKMQNSPVELAKLGYPAMTNGNYTPSIPMLIYAAIGWADPSVLDSFPKSSDGMAWSDWPDSERTIYGRGYYGVSVTARVRTISFEEPDALYQLNMDGYDRDAMAEALDWVESTCDSVGYDGAYERVGVQKALFAKTSFNYSITGSLPVFYPYYLDAETIIVPYSARIEIRNRNQFGDIETHTYNVHLFGDKPELFIFTTDFQDVRGSFAPTGVVEIVPSTYHTFIDAYDITDMVNGYLELSGKFGKPTRDGGVEFVTLDPTAITEIGRGDYETMWWDEYDVSPIGTVAVKYGDGVNTDNTAYISIGDGSSVYDMTDNDPLQHMSSADIDTITELLSGEFASNAANVGFTPTELSMQGWPWMEAGDALEITAEDGTVVDTYALRLELSGIQHLTADIVSEGGEIIGEV